MKMTKISLAVAMLGLSAVAFAGMPGNQVAAPSGVNLIAPDSVGVWSVGLEAMYVQQTNNDLNYGQLETTTGTSPSTFVDRDNENVGNNWEWGGTVDLTYLFPGQSRDVKLAWTHLFSSTDSDSTPVGGGQVLTPSFFNPNAFLNHTGTLGSLFQDGDAHGSTKTNYDAIDLVFGQWIKIGDRLDLHPFGGLRWAQVNTTDKGNYYQGAVFDAIFNAPVNENSLNKLTSNFNGIGPRAGFDTAVHLGSGFSIVGTFAGSLLIGSLGGNIKQSDNVFDAPTGALLGTSSSEISGSNNGTAVVPELDARLGLDYMYAFTPSTSMNFQLGYQVVNYFDVTEADFQSDAGSTFGVIPNTTASRSDWGYQGPYLRLQLNVA